MSSSAADWMCTLPWCIAPAAFEAMLSIAEREPLSEAEIAAAMHGPKSLALRQGKRRDDGGRMTMQGDVAIIPVDGPIFRYADLFVRVSGGVTTEQLARDYQAAIDDPNVSAIVSVFDSPGGEGQGINELADMIYAMRGRKPLIAYVEGQAASAAYWIASAHDEIVIDDSALVGSIGTIVSVPDPSKRFSRSIDFVSSQSPRKRPDPTSDMGKADIQAIADALTEVFIAKVARNRNVSIETVMADFGQGAQLVGRGAIAVGMADRLGSEDRIIQELSVRAQRRRAFSFRQPASAPAVATEESMKVSQFIASIFTGAKEAGIELEADEAPATMLAAPAAATQAAAAEPSLESAARDARIAELEQRLAAQRTQQIAASAAQFADRAVRERRAFPAEHSALVALYTQATQDDDVSPAADEQTGRVTQLEAAISARPPHSLSSELIASGAGGVLESDTGPKPMTEARRRYLLSLTPGGHAVLSDERVKSA